jgi:hypothetical protein
MAKKVQFKYLYRDAGNYKIYGEEIFLNPDGISIQEIESKIRTALIDGQFFDPKKWGVKRLRFEEWDEELDHEWNEFESVEEIIAKPGRMRAIHELLFTI